MFHKHQQSSSMPDKIDDAILFELLPFELLDHLNYFQAQLIYFYVPLLLFLCSVKLLIKLHIKIQMIALIVQMNKK